MKTIMCSTCKVAVDETMTHCPLCGKYLGHHVYDSTSESYPLPNYRRLQVEHERLAFFTFLALSVFASVVAGLVNWLVAPQHAWSVYAVIGILYLWILIGHTIISSSTIGQKLVYQWLGISAFSIVVDFLTGQSGFSTDYLVPLLTAFIQLSLLIIIWTSVHARRHDLLKLVFLMLMGFLPILGYQLTWVDMAWPPLVSAGISILTLVSLIFAQGPAIWNDLKGKFHI